ncbi:MAG: hypothetical protein WC059_02700 [Candidatus Paceibacterota bacterium]
MKKSKVTLCPLYGDISIDWKNNLLLEKSMLNWPIFYDDKDRGQISRKEERSYQNALKALSQIPNFNFFVGLEADMKKKRLVFWNYKFNVHIYIENKKVLELPITGHGLGAGVMHHFNGMHDYVEKYTPGESPVLDWTTNQWIKYFSDKIRQYCDSCSKQMRDLEEQIIDLNKSRINTLRRLEV